MNKRIKSINTLAETKYLSLYDAEYENKKGRLKHWTIASRKNTETLKAQVFDGKPEKIDAVVIAALHSNLNKLVLLRQFRIPVNDYIYELPAGLIDENENVYDAVRRELKEETGLNLVSVCGTKNFPPVYASPGMTDESVALVYCLCDGEVSVEYMEEDEDIEVVLVSPQEGAELLGKNVKFDVKAYMALQSFAAMGERMFI